MSSPSFSSAIAAISAERPDASGASSRFAATAPPRFSSALCVNPARRSAARRHPAPGIGSTGGGALARSASRRRRAPASRMTSASAPSRSSAPRRSVQLGPGAGRNTDPGKLDNRSGARHDSRPRPRRLPSGRSAHPRPLFMQYLEGTVRVGRALPRTSRSEPRAVRRPPPRPSPSRALRPPPAPGRSACGAPARPGRATPRRARAANRLVREHQVADVRRVEGPAENADAATAGAPNPGSALCRAGRT